MISYRKFLKKIINYIADKFGIRKLMREDGSKKHPLSGDRAIEWSWVVVNLPMAASKILDIGCVGSVLTGVASRCGHFVTAVDINDIEYKMKCVNFQKGNFNDLDFGSETFDLIIACSVIEHVGLGNRYGSADQKDGDLLAMKKIRNLLKQNGKVILTIPVGIDAKIDPYHRIYGLNRITQLLSGYKIIAEEFWEKFDDLWIKSTAEKVFNIEGNSEYYALGLYILMEE